MRVTAAMLAANIKLRMGSAPGTGWFRSQ